MEPWQIWVLVAIALIIAEIFVSGLFLACLGIGCLATATVCGLGMRLEWQIVVFALVTLGVFVGIRPVFLRHLAGRSRLTNVDAMIGRKGRVSETIDPSIGTGRVVVKGIDWKAVTSDDIVIQKGSGVEVMSVQGTSLTVKPIQ